MDLEDYQIFKNIKKHITLNNDDIDYLKSILSIQVISKNNLLVHQGQICRKLFFVEEGSLRAFNMDTKGKESTIMFAIEDWWITDMYSFVNQKPAMLCLETLEKSKIVELNFDAFQELLWKLPKFERFFRILFQNAYVREQVRVLKSISSSTEQRFYQFLEKYPQISDRVSQKQIASYLGVTPEFLSSIKRK